MATRRTLVPLAALAWAGCAQGMPTASSQGGEQAEPASAESMPPRASSGAVSDGASRPGSNEGDGGTISAGADPDAPDSDSDDSEGGEPAVDCTPRWEKPWIGSPCATSSDCAFDRGRCLREADGFPCGTCSQACEMVCPDLDGTPVTFCINGVDVGQAESGYCVSKCEVERLGGNGCRDGYVCEQLERIDGSARDSVCIPQAFDAVEGIVDHRALIEHLGGVVVDPANYGSDLDSFARYLAAVGVMHTDAVEVAEPHQPAVATGCGYTLLLPPREQWVKAAALALLTDELIDFLGEPIYVRNWWRPPCYNAGVGGAPGGDHPDADAFDLDFSSATSRALAQRYLCEAYWSQDLMFENDAGEPFEARLNLSVGLGRATIHLGVLSQRGRRFWFYSGYTEEPESGNCW